MENESICEVRFENLTIVIWEIDEAAKILSNFVQEGVEG